MKNSRNMHCDYIPTALAYICFKLTVGIVMRAERDTGSTRLDWLRYIKRKYIYMSIMLRNACSAHARITVSSSLTRVHKIVLFTGGLYVQFYTLIA